MAVVYTVAHPVTSEIVYVGASNNLSKRISVHVSSRTISPVSLFIQSLRNNYLLPKIEPLEYCDSHELLYFEKYWIQQLQSWGFELLNKQGKVGLKVRGISLVGLRGAERIKARKLKSGYVKLTPEQWAEKRRVRDEGRPVKIRTTKKWGLTDFELGTTHEFKNRSVYVIVFRQMAKRHDIFDRWLFIKETSDGFLGTVVNEKPIYSTIPRHRTKKGTWSYHIFKNKPKVVRRAKGKKFTYGFKDVQLGDSLSINISRFESFKISLKSYNDRYSPTLYIKYELSVNLKTIKIIYISQQESIDIKLPKIPKGLQRPADAKRRSILSREQKQEICTANKGVRELAIIYNVSESTVYKVKDKITRTA